MQSKDCDMTLETHAAIGFTAISSGSKSENGKSQDALKRALNHFNDIHQLKLDIGNTKLTIWGRGRLKDCYYQIPEGSTLILIGSPVGDFTWSEIAEWVMSSSTSKPFVLPWEGRVILIKIDPKGDIWTLWNDWMGGIPIFHTQLKSGRIASTLEPVVVAGGGFSADNFYSPAVVSLLIHGHFLGDWTLYKDIKVVPPDCMSEWEDRDFSFRRNLTVEASDNRWEASWDELVDEMYFLSRKAIAEMLQSHPAWICPLSSGLDSRLIATVASEMGVECNTYSWGSPDTSDVNYSQQIAGVLGLPWKRVDLGADYLVEYTQLWADLFGSAMHFHGMYQMPFLDSLESEPSGPIASGFIGDGLAGFSVRYQSELFSPSKRVYQAVPDGYLHWLVKDIPNLMRIQTDEALEEIAAEISRSINSLQGPWFQKLRLMTFWQRQNHFTYFQSTISDYWRGVGTPFLNREYARFCLSLPRSVLDDRRLQIEMFRRYYSKVAAIPGTYGNEPMYYSVRYVLKRRVAQLLAGTSLDGSLQLINRNRSQSDVECVKNHGWDAFWPIQKTMEELNEWINTGVLAEVYDEALGGSMKAVRQLQSVQTLAYRLNGS
ncbi:asparagine synthase-related protein [Chloroflexota bacterium]